MRPEFRHFRCPSLSDGIELAEAAAFFVADGFKMLASAGPSIWGGPLDVGGYIGIETEIASFIEVFGAGGCIERYDHCFRSLELHIEDVVMAQKTDNTYYVTL